MYCIVKCYDNSDAAPRWAMIARQYGSRHSVAEQAIPMASRGSGVCWWDQRGGRDGGAGRGQLISLWGPSSVVRVAGRRRLPDLA
jgi:hypothetical protein